MVLAGYPQLMADKPPLVVHVIHHLFMGGMENGLVNLINHMPAGKYRHAVLCVEDYSDFRNRITRSDVDVIALYRSRIGLWKLRQEIYRWMRCHRHGSPAWRTACTASTAGTCTTSRASNGGR
jgi:hypothetical protein